MRIRAYLITTQPFDNWTGFYNLNTGLIHYLDPPMVLSCCYKFLTFLGLVTQNLLTINRRDKRRHGSRVRHRVNLLRHRKLSRLCNQELGMESLCHRRFDPSNFYPQTFKAWILFRAWVEIFWARMARVRALVRALIEFIPSVSRATLLGLKRRSLFLVMPKVIIAH